MKFKLIILDYDGTICDTRKAILYSIKETFKFYNYEIPLEDRIMELISKGISLTETFSMLSNEIKSSDLEQWTLKYREIYKLEGDNHSELYKNVYATLNEIFLNKIPIIVLSNKGISAINQSLKNNNLDQFISMIIGDGYSEKKIELKPNPMVFNEVIKPKFLDILNEDILMVGDTKADIDFANNCNIKSCWASYGYGLETITIETAPHFTINSFDEIQKIITNE